MLFTRCPGCQTTFRITADTLRIANGHVRCGSCATVFSVYSGLRQDSLAESLREDDEYLSPTLQSRELAEAEEIESPELQANDAGNDTVVDESATEDEPPIENAVGAIRRQEFAATDAPAEEGIAAGDPASEDARDADRGVDAEGVGAAALAASSSAEPSRYPRLTT
jgi:predicted Zn finger-like uncharacterized protein